MNNQSDYSEYEESVYNDVEFQERTEFVAGDVDGVFCWSNIDHRRRDNPYLRARSRSMTALTDIVGIGNFIATVQLPPFSLFLQRPRFPLLSMSCAPHPQFVSCPRLFYTLSVPSFYQTPP